MATGGFLFSPLFALNVAAVSKRKCTKKKTGKNSFTCSPNGESPPTAEISLTAGDIPLAWVGRFPYRARPSLFLLSLFVADSRLFSCSKGKKSRSRLTAAERGYALLHALAVRFLTSSSLSSSLSLSLSPSPLSPCLRSLSHSSLSSSLFFIF